MRTTFGAVCAARLRGSEATKTLPCSRRSFISQQRHDRRTKCHRDGDEADGQILDQTWRGSIVHLTALAVSVLARPAAGLWTNGRGKTEVRDDHLRENLRACHDLLLPVANPHRGGRLVKRSCSWSRQASLGRS